MKGRDESENTRALLFEGESSKFRGRKPFFEIFLGGTRGRLGDDFNGAWKLGNHHFHELLSSLVFDFLVPSLLFCLY